MGLESKKVCMVRMYSSTDELVNVHLYILSISNGGRCLIKVMCGISKSIIYESPIVVTGYYQAHRGIART